jgi:hypothetical protein
MGLSGPTNPVSKWSPGAAFSDHPGKAAEVNNRVISALRLLTFWIVT